MGKGISGKDRHGPAALRAVRGLCVNDQVMTNCPRLCCEPRACPVFVYSRDLQLGIST